MSDFDQFSIGVGKGGGGGRHVSSATIYWSVVNNVAEISELKQWSLAKLTFTVYGMTNGAIRFKLLPYLTLFFLFFFFFWGNILIPIFLSALSFNLSLLVYLALGANYKYLLHHSVRFSLPIHRLNGDPIDPVTVEVIMTLHWAIAPEAYNKQLRFLLHYQYSYNITVLIR